MAGIVFFKEFRCPKCSTFLGEIHYKNFGMVRFCCKKCGKWVLVNKQAIVKDYR